MAGSKRVIRKSNDLIEAKYKLSLEEQKIIAYLASAIKWDDTDFQTVDISVVEFCKCIGIRKDQFYQAFVEISQNLVGKALIIVDKQTTTIVPWLARTQYHDGKGYVSLTFSEELRPHLLQLKGFYTTYHADNIMRLRSVYTFRIYELLKQYEKIGWREFNVEDLKDRLRVSDMYKNYYDFKKFTIERAQEEMKKKCDVYFEFTEIKLGRRIVAIHFDIFPNVQVKAIKALHDSEAGMSLLEDLNAPKRPELPKKDKEIQETQPPRNLKTLLSFMDSGYNGVTFSYGNLCEIHKNAKADVDVIRFCYGVLLDREDIANPTGWMIKAVRAPEEYGYDRNAAIQPEPKKVSKPRSRGKKNPFCNFDQRENDHEELARLELEQFRQYIQQLNGESAQSDSEPNQADSRQVKKDVRSSKQNSIPDFLDDDDFDDI